MYASEAQRGYFHAHKAELEKQGVDVDEWDRASKGKELPARAAKEKTMKKNLMSAISGLSAAHGADHGDGKDGHHDGKDGHHDGHDGKKKDGAKKKPKVVNLGKGGSFTVHSGKLHEHLGIPKGEKIGQARINKALHSTNPEVRHEAASAKGLTHMHHGGK